VHAWTGKLRPELHYCKKKIKHVKPKEGDVSHTLPAVPIIYLE